MAKVNRNIEKAYDILRTMSQDREARAPLPIKINRTS